MAINVIDATVTDQFAVYHGDAVEVLAGIPKRIRPLHDLFPAVRIAIHLFE